MSTTVTGGTSSPLLVRDVGVARVAPGLCEPPPTDSYRLSINTGAAVWATCCRPGRPRRYLRTPGGINFAPPGATVGWVMDSPVSLLKLSVPRTLIRTAAQDLDLDARTLDFATAIQVREAQIEWLARALQAEDAAGNPHGLLFRESLGLALSIVLVRKFACASAGAGIEAGRLAPLQLQRITDYIETHLGRQDLSLRELAGVAGMSVSHFKSLFKRRTGVSAHRFVVQRRVERAAALLRVGHLSITDVALETGFAHATHLARWTRRLLGASPRQLSRG